MTTEEFNLIKKHTLGVVKRNKLKVCYLDDFLGQAYLTYVEEKPRWDDRKGRSFITYVKMMITYRILDFNRTFYFSQKNTQNLTKGTGFRQDYDFDYTTIKDDAIDIDQIIDSNKIINQVLLSGKFSKNQRRVFFCILLGYKQYQIANHLEICRSRVAQLTNRIIEKLSLRIDRNTQHQ